MSGVCPFVSSVAVTGISYCKQARGRSVLSQQCQTLVLKAAFALAADDERELPGEVTPVAPAGSALHGQGSRRGWMWCLGTCFSGRQCWEEF